MENQTNQETPKPFNLAEFGKQLKENLLKRAEEFNDYYSVGISDNPSDWVLSNSALNMLDPERKGHPKKLYAFMTDTLAEREESKALERGKLLHEYMEHKDNFAISEVPKPDAKLGLVADELVSMLSGLENPLESVDNEEFKTNILLTAIRKVGWNDKWSDEAVIKNSKDVVWPYVIEYFTIKDKYILTKEMGSTLQKCIESINSNAVIVAKTFDFPEGQINEYQFNIVLKEYPIVEIVNNTKLKGKLDRVNIELSIAPDDFEGSTLIIKVTIIDYKTTRNVNSIADTINYYKYDRQLWLYKTMFDYLLSDELCLVNYDISIYVDIVAVETTDLFISQYVRLGDSYLTQGEKDFNDLMTRYSYHKLLDNFNLTMEEIKNNGMIFLPFKAREK